MDDEEDPAESLKTKLRPRNPGESIKVAETVLKRRERNLSAAADRAQSIARLQKARNDYKKGKVSFIRPETLIKQNAIKKYDRQRVLRVKAGAKRQKNPGPGKVLAVVRNGRMGGTVELRRTLRALHLPRRNHLTFLANTKDTLLKLQICKPFVFWGVPSFKTVFNVMSKKALFREPNAGVNGKDGVLELSDNTLIETHLGDLGIICTDDLAHILHTGGKGFDEVTGRLWSVPLGDPMKANGMVYDKKFTYGPLGVKEMNQKVAAILGE